MFSFYIARRYLLTKKSHHVINIISGISVCGIAIATAALVCILSVFNGFQDMVAGLFTTFDPELKIVAAEGKFFDADTEVFRKLKAHRSIDVYSEVLQDNALLVANNRQVMTTIKGVDDNFERLIEFDRIKFGDGAYELHADVIDYGILGINLLSNLGLDVSFSTPIQVYAPTGDEQIDMNDPSESFNSDELYSPHVAFSMKQQKYDSNYTLTSLRFARALFEREGLVSSVEMKLKTGSDVEGVKSEIKKELGDEFMVLDRYEQQEETFKIMKIEKLISYIFLTFILIIACFNIIGSVSMLIIDKKTDMMTLRNLGADEGQIASIFMTEGRMISVLGAVLGIVLGLALCLIQQHYGLIRFGKSAGSYIIDAYPVSVHAMDIIIVFVTVIVVGFLSVWYPVKQLSRKYTSVVAILLMVVMTSSCGGDATKFKITGRIQDMPMGQLYIYNQSDDNAQLDTIYLNDGKWQYVGSAEGTTPYVLVFPNALEQVIFVKNGNLINYKAAANDLKNYSVDEIDENKWMNEFREKTNGMTSSEIKEMAKQYINEHAESVIATYLFDRYFIQDEKASVGEISKVFEQIKKLQPHNSYVLSIGNKLKNITRGQVGKTVPKIEIQTIGKKTLNIGTVSSDKLVLVFWAQWMPDQYGFLRNLSRIAREHQEGEKVKMVAISLDSERYKWQECVREDSVLCEHSCDGMAWESDPVKKLGVTEIPTYIIADKHHKIIARGNSMDDLQRELNHDR